MTAGFTLRPFAPGDLDFAWSLETQPRLRTAGLLGGRVPSRPEFEAMLWQSTYAQFVVVDGNRDIGVATLRDADQLNGVVSAYVVTSDDTLQAVSDAKRALFDLALGDTPFRKIYDDSPDVVVEAPDSDAPIEALPPVQREGLLIEHYARGASFLHKPVVSVSREDWRTYRDSGSGGRRETHEWHGPDAPGSLPPAIDESASAVPALPRRGKHALLRPITAADYESLRIAELSPELGPRWRHRGATPSSEAYVRGLSAGVLAQFLVITRTEGRPVAIASAYNLDPLNRFAYISLARLPHAEPRRCVLEGMLLFVDYVFACWPLRKLYAEAIEFNLEQFASGSGRSFRTEARLVERTFYAGRFWDVLIIAVDRASWSKYAAPLLPAIVAEP